MAVVKIWYHDHHDGVLKSGEVRTRVPNCLNMNMGEVVYEDKDWIRLMHGIGAYGTEDEDYETVTIRKVDIVKKE